VSGDQDQVGDSPPPLSISLGTIVAASAAPYGYTVSLWSAGALLIHFRGMPNVGDVFLFAAGALTGFTAIGLLARRSLEMNDPLPPGPDRVLAGVMHWFAVGIAVGAVALLAQIPSWIAWPLGSFWSTVLYLFGASLQLALLRRRGSG
jgi:hypothetical protein